MGKGHVFFWATATHPGADLSKPEDQKGGGVGQLLSSYSHGLDPGAKLCRRKMTMEYHWPWQGLRRSKGSSPCRFPARQSSLGGAHTYDMILNGEVLQHGQMFENLPLQVRLPGLGRRPKPPTTRCRSSSRASASGRYLLVVSWWILN